MKTNTPIHLVKPKNYDALNDICAVFDSKEKAVKFVAKFKNRPDMEIVEGILNPDSSIEKKTFPYYVSLTRTSSIPKDIFVCDYNGDTDNGKDEYNISFYGDIKSQQGLFILKVVAVDEQAALKKAISIRNATIKSGKWDQAWEEYKFQQSRLKVKRF